MMLKNMKDKYIFIILLKKGKNMFGIDGLWLYFYWVLNLFFVYLDKYVK